MKITINTIGCLRTPLRAKKKEVPKIEAAVKALRIEGYTLSKIGGKLGVTASRVSQIANDYTARRREELKKRVVYKPSVERGDLPVWLL